MLTKEEIREALVERHSEEVQSKLDEANYEFKPSAVSHGTYWQIQDGSTFGGTSGNQSIP